MGSFDAKAIGTTLALDIFEGRLRGHADDPYGAPLVYIVMKYVHGESLAERLRREGSLPTEDARRILHELAHFSSTIGNPDNATVEQQLWNDCVKN